MTDTPLELHVAPNGNDRWTGALVMPAADGTDGPLATLAAARDAIRRARAAGAGNRPVTVTVQTGIYELAGTLTFTPADSGTAAAPVCYVAAAGAAPVLSGGRRVTGWQETTHAGLRCWTAELPEVAAGCWDFTRLYVNDTARPRPRLPKTGYYRFTGVAGYTAPGSDWCTGPDRANFAPGEIRPWHNWEDAELITYQLWFDTHHRLKAIDEATRTVHFHAMSLGSLKDERGEFARYFVENVFEALDTPGQWYLDRRAGRLYYLPLPGEQIGTAVVIAPRLTELVRVQGANGRRVGHLHFENLTFAHQHWVLPTRSPGYIQAASGVPGAIILKGADACVFYGCTVAHVNGYGLEVLADSTGNIIAACTVHDAGGGGIKIGHEQMDRTDPTTADETPVSGDVPAMSTTVVDCTIRDCGHIYPSAIGIWVGNSGWNRLLHNHIFNCNYTGISCGWTWGYSPTRTVCNRIEFNHIHHINHHAILSDNGGIYTLGQQPGTVLRGNVIHDIACYGYGAWGIYPDEGSSEMRIEQNLVCGTQKAAFMTHYGRDNLVQQNIFALSREEHLCLGNREAHRATVLRHNVVLTTTGQFQSRHVNWDPAHYTVTANLFWTLDGSPVTFNNRSLASLQECGLNTGAVVADPLFADAAGGDFTLRSDSPVYRVGFRPFDWRAAGLRLRGTRPFDYPAYAGRYPLPSLDQPVVRTKIELLTPVTDAFAGRQAEFRVTLSNIGRATARGTVRLSAGPRTGAGSPNLRRIAYELAPGEARSALVTLKVRRKTREFWLDTEPADAHTVPARGLVLDPSTARWHVSRVAAVMDPGAVARALARVPARELLLGNRLVASVTLGATDNALLFLARFSEPNLRPNLAQPWKGTALELISYQATHRQIFLVPRVADGGVDVLRTTPEGIQAAAEIRCESEQTDTDCLISAIIPWGELGLTGTPGEFPFALMADVMDPLTENIVQVPAMDPPAVCSAWKHGMLIIE